MNTRQRDGWRSRLLAGTICATMLAGGGGAAIAQERAGDTGFDNDIVVTASKRRERVQDVAISMTAISGEALAKQGAQGMGDYLQAQPSVVIQDRGPARNQVVIRGLATTVEFENPTVAFYLDEVPVINGLGAGANGFPDLKAFDLNRVEVLRGPQGTLYGAGSMGGTVKLVPNAPVLGKMSIDGELSASSTNGAAGSYNAAAAVNVPVTDTVALRAVGYHYRQGGFIDNVYSGSPDPSLPVAGLGGLSWSDVGVSSFGVAARNKENANSTDTTGARAYLLFDPDGPFSLKLGALYQIQKGHGLPEEVPSVGKYKQDRFMEEVLRDKFQLYDALIKYELGAVDLTSSTSYMIRDQRQARDVSTFFLTSPIALVDDNNNKTFVQEVRLSSPDDGAFRWLVGAYYQRTTSDALQNAEWRGTDQSLVEFTSLLTALGAVPAPVYPGGDLYVRDDHHVARQVAGFGEISYALTSKIRASAGMRWSHYKQTVDAFADGAFNGGATLDHLSSSESTVTPKFEVEYKADRDHLHYVRVAKGFRPGAPNQSLPTTCASDLADIGLTSAPDSLKSDKLWSYELGSKNTFNGGRTRLNAAIYYIDWRDIQTNFLLSNCGFAFASNAGKARSQGVELEFAHQLSRALNVSVQASYTDATLRGDSPEGTGIGGKKGDRLPGIPKWTASGSAEYRFALGEHESFLRGDVRYISGYLNRFPGDIRGLVETAGDYMTVDLRAGTEIDSALRLELFASNLFNVHQKMVVDTELPDSRRVVGRPRTIGMTLRFGY
ncbi:MAG: TonB-dependent receptor [Sphingobium sp.]